MLQVKIVYGKDLIECGEIDMVIKYFLDLLPEDNMPHPTLLTKFRKIRLKDENILSKLLVKTLNVVNELCIINSKTIIMDSTHTKSVYNPKTPIEILSEESKSLRKTVYETREDYKNKKPSQPTNPNEYIKYCQELK